MSIMSSLTLWRPIPPRPWYHSEWNTASPTLPASVVISVSGKQKKLNWKLPNTMYIRIPKKVTVSRSYFCRSQNLDWGIHQLDSVMDRKEVTGSHFLVLTNFGDHALHHMFPTLDCGLLDPLYPLFLNICKQFDVDWKLTTQLDMIRGQYSLLANTVPYKYKKYQPKK